jgi:hypothetical protein
VKKTIKKPLSKSQERNRRIQFNMHIGQENEVVYQAQKTIPGIQPTSMPLPMKL